MKRREFVARAGLAGLAVAVAPLAWAGDNNSHQNQKTMKTRKLGKLEVSELGAGCMSIMANYGPPASKAQGEAE